VAQAEAVDVADRRQDDLGRERERRHDRPRSERSVVGPARDRARDVIKESPLDAVDDEPDRAGPLARRDSPAPLSVPLELPRVCDPVELMRACRAPAVLEVIAALRPHERVADPAKINPDVGELADEERAGVEELFAVE